MNFFAVFSYVVEVYREDEIEHLEDKEKRHKAMNTRCKMGNYDYILQFSHSCQTLEQVSQRDCRISIPGVIQNSTGHGPEQSDLAGSAFSRRLDQMTSRGPCQSKLFYDQTASL